MATWIPIGITQKVVQRKYHALIAISSPIHAPQHFVTLARPTLPYKGVDKTRGNWQ